MPEIVILILMVAVLAFVWKLLLSPHADPRPALPLPPPGTPRDSIPLPSPAPPKKKTRKQRRAENAAASTVAKNSTPAPPPAPAVKAPPPAPAVKAPPPAPAVKAPPPAPAVKAPPAPAKATEKTGENKPPKPKKNAGDPSLVKATCIEVVDGDTLVYRDDHRRVRKLRLKGIDSPEYRPLQEHGAEAKQALAGKVDGRRIELRILEVDQHGRDLGIVFHLGRNINEELVAEGHAWNFAYRSDPAHPRLDSLERQARSGRKGLWLGQRPMHPKDFRARNRS